VEVEVDAVRGWKWEQKKNSKKAFESGGVYRRKSDQDVPIGRRGEEFSDRTAEMGRWAVWVERREQKRVADSRSTHAEKEEKG
jgi:hypothetical protein